MSLSNLKNKLAINLFGMTKDGAITKNICIQCKEPISPENIYSEAGKREYQISGMCEKCYDAIFDGE